MGYYINKAYRRLNDALLSKPHKKHRSLVDVLLMMPKDKPKGKDDWMVVEPFRVIESFYEREDEEE
jgi:hypothetical protein